MSWALDALGPAAPPPWRAGTPWRALTALVLFALVAATLAAGGALPASAARAAATAALHGALLATAIGWTARDDATVAAAWDPEPAILLLAGLTALAATLSARDEGGGGVVWLLPGVVWGRLAGAGRLAGLGLRRGAGTGALRGAALGAALGGHMLLAASFTDDHRWRSDGVAGYAAALAYDLGVNVPASETFFRGALLRRALARWSLAGAAVVTTLAGLGRYLVDPRLPASAETRVGALVYLALLGGGSAWLVARSGSIAPALAAAATFFAAYRLLAPA